MKDTTKTPSIILISENTKTTEKRRSCGKEGGSPIDYECLDADHGYVYVRHKMIQTK